MCESVYVYHVAAYMIYGDPHVNLFQDLLRPKYFLNLLTFLAHTFFTFMFFPSINPLIWVIHPFILFLQLVLYFLLITSCSSTVCHQILKIHLLL